LFPKSIYDICSVLSDSNSVRAVRRMGEDVIAGGEGLQGRGLLDIHPGIELVAGGCLHGRPVAVADGTGGGGGDGAVGAHR
jgi:hypothetical protein